MNFLVREFNSLLRDRSVFTWSELVDLVRSVLVRVVQRIAVPVRANDCHAPTVECWFVCPVDPLGAGVENVGRGDRGALFSQMAILFVDLSDSCHFLSL